MAALALSNSDLFASNLNSMNNTTSPTSTILPDMTKKPTSNLLGTKLSKGRRYTVWDIILSVFTVAALALSVTALVKSSNVSMDSVQVQDTFRRNVIIDGNLSVSEQVNVANTLSAPNDLTAKNANISALTISQSVTASSDSATLTMPTINADNLEVKKSGNFQGDFSVKGDAKFENGTVTSTTANVNVLTVKDTLQLGDLQIAVNNLSASAFNPFVPMEFTFIQTLSGTTIDGQEAFVYKGSATEFGQNLAGNLIYPANQNAPTFTGLNGAENVVNVPSEADSKNSNNPITVSTGLWLIWGTLTYSSDPGTSPADVKIELSVGLSNSGTVGFGLLTQSFTALNFNIVNGNVSTSPALVDATATPQSISCVWSLQAQGGEATLDVVSVSNFTLIGLRVG